MSLHAAPKAAGNRRNKVLAILSAGVVLGVGASLTLASWNDSEWVFGGVDGSTPGIGTSTFEVEQNRGTAWDQFETADGGALGFSTGALALTPGDATYAPVALRTTATSIAGDLALKAAVQSATLALASDADLWAALELRVVVAPSADHTTAPVCSAALFVVGADFVVGTATTKAPLVTAGTGTEVLNATSGNQQNYCFEISLPAGSPDTLQGKTVTPVWEFVGTSV